VAISIPQSRRICSILQRYQSLSPTLNQVARVPPGSQVAASQCSLQVGAHKKKPELERNSRQCIYTCRQSGGWWVRAAFSVIKLKNGTLSSLPKIREVVLNNLTHMLKIL